MFYRLILPCGVYKYHQRPHPETPLFGQWKSPWVFFCDPMNSNQKSQEERNHEFVREVQPKGVSFDGLTQEDASLMMYCPECRGRTLQNMLAQILVPCHGNAANAGGCRVRSSGSGSVNPNRRSWPKRRGRIKCDRQPPWGL